MTSLFGAFKSSSVYFPAVLDARTVVTLGGVPSKTTAVPLVRDVYTGLALFAVSLTNNEKAIGPSGSVFFMV